MTRTLLIDADIIAYQSTAVTQKTYDWGDGVVSKSADFDAAKEAARDTVDYYMETLKAHSLIICLSDDFQNFRKGLYPEYKNNRKGMERPEHLYDLKDWLASEYPTQTRPTLEADDVMGILSTEPHKGDRIIVSDDKDMQTVPGLLVRPCKDMKVRRITPEFAERFMLYQALIGDQTDGYPGCPGVGPKGADAILDEGHAHRKYVKVLKSGPRKGQEEVSWKLEPDELGLSTWARIKLAYHRYGLTEKDAIVQVNLARILKHMDMDGDRIIPWTPDMLSKSAN